jgi:FMN reductase [NAD(P)H]
MRSNEMPSHHGVEAPVDGKYPNQTLKLLIERASCRDFSSKKISPDVLRFILSAGVHAPTGGNLQPYSIIKIENDKTKRKLAEMCGQDFIGEVPVLLLFCIDFRRIERWAKLEIAPFTATSAFPHFWISFIDTVACAQIICTAADSLGLGSVYIGTILEFLKDIQRMFQLPKGVFPVVLLCLGYPKAKLVSRKKLDYRIVVHAEKYHEIEDQKLIEAFNEKYPDLKVEITEERLETISEVCKKVHGEEFAKNCVEKIRKNGYINPIQRYFGLHYRADIMSKDNDAYLKIMKEFGFNWFKKYHPPKEFKHKQKTK